MKKTLILIALAMTCKQVADNDWSFTRIRRCENEEAVCYQTATSGIISCFFKPVVKP